MYRVRKRVLVKAIYFNIIVKHINSLSVPWDPAVGEATSSVHRSQIAVVRRRAQRAFAIFRWIVTL
jgi:hypothetical protein